MRRILQISDLHFGPPHLPSTVTGLLDVVRRRRPDLVVVAGDLTERARSWQFEHALDFVRLLEREVPVLTVPGEHDVPLYRIWERLFDPFGAYRRHFNDELEPTYRDDELCVVGINTASAGLTRHGRITRRSLRHVEETLAEVRNEPGLCRIAVAHHPLIASTSLHGQRLVHGAAKTARLLADRGVEILLSGHVHHFHSALLGQTHRDLEREVLVLHSGTATSNRGAPPESGCNSCVFLEIRAEEIDFERLGWQPLSGAFETEASFTYDRDPRSSGTGAKEHGEEPGDAA